MSAISEINKVWIQKFPGSSLPDAWAEDVKTNLSKHKKRVLELEEELKQEKVYVEFLETLLAEVEQVNTPQVAAAVAQTPECTNGVGTTQDMDDVIKDTLERRSISQFTFPQIANCLPIQENSNDTPPFSNEEPPNGADSEDDLSKREGDFCADGIQRCGEGDDTIEENVDRDHFVTVIEVNGFHKKVSSSSPSQNSSVSALAPTSISEDPKRLKKVPPRPPPKHTKRPGSDTSTTPADSQTQPSSSAIPEAEAIDAEQPKVNGENRPIVFDSRKLSTGSKIDEIVGEPKLPVTFSPLKRFEGSKLPLPGNSQGAQGQGQTGESEVKGPTQVDLHHPYLKQHSMDEKEGPPTRSKILDLVNRMESSGKLASAKGEPLTPRRSFRKQFQGPVYHSVPVEPTVSDYVDPCDAEFDMAGNNDQIYDSPPPEEEDFMMEHNLDSPQNRSKTSTLDTRISDIHLDPTNYLDNEPMYDTVAPDQDDDYVLLLEEGNQTSSSANSLNKKDKEVTAENNDVATIKSQTSVISGQSIATTTSSGTASDTEGITGSPLPESSRKDPTKCSIANYVNIDYFLSNPGRKDSQYSGESDDDEEPSLQRSASLQADSEIQIDTPIDEFSMDSGVFAGGSESSPGIFGSVSTSPGGSSRMGNCESTTMTAADHEKLARFRYLLTNIAESEGSYVEVLHVLLQYMKALKATLGTSKPVMSQDEFSIIFYKIPELYELHQKFWGGLKDKSGTSVGKHFKILARSIWVYGAFLQNYSRAVETVRKCSQNNAEFCEIAKNIRLKPLQNQAVSLETLLYSPVSRVQKNTEIIQDLLKYLPVGHPDEVTLRAALKEFQSFLTEFKMIQPEQLFQGQDRNSRHLVKNSFIVELSEGHRKLRHIFLFNDVFVCAKYKSTGKSEKFTFELKWYIPVGECSVLEENSEPKESTVVNLVALRSQASTVRDQIKRQTSRDDPKKAKAEKQRKKLAELEAQLVLASPNLVFKMKAGTGRAYTFFLSSEYERSQWVDAIDVLKARQPTTSQLSMQEMQNWLTSCRKHLKTNMGSYLLRSGHDENLLVGDLYILIEQLKGIQRSADLYICIEVDSYGHFFRKAKTKMVCESIAPCWNQDFTIELEGAQNLRILLYEDHQRQGTLIRAKTTIELNKSWLAATMTERKIDLQEYVLTLFTKFTPSEMTIRRVPTAKPSGLFGAKITQVCKREKRQVPFILTSCLREVERRGINEVGIYRVSGSTSDVSRLKKAFETNCYEAEQLLKEVDIHSVTGILKLYMRELPEALFTDELYPRFFEAFNQSDQEMKKRILLQLFSTLPPINQHIILSLLDHMVRVNKHENHNKMSLHNIATVFGPTLLRPGAKNESNASLDLLAAGTVDVMAQAGILYFFLTRRASGEPMQLLPAPIH